MRRPEVTDRGKLGQIWRWHKLVGSSFPRCVHSVAALRRESLFLVCAAYCKNIINYTFKHEAGPHT